MNIDYHALAPELILSGTILLVLVVDVFLPERRKWWAMPLGLVGVLAAMAATLSLIGGGTRVLFDGTYVVDNFALLFKVFFLSVAVVVLALSLRYFREGGFYQGEYYFLLLTSFLGCVMMPSSRDMLLLFIALELVSAPGFLMAAFRKGDIKSNEAGVKFFIIGVLSTAVMLFGMSLIYGVTGGATQLNEIAARLSEIPPIRNSWRWRRSCSSWWVSRSRSARCPSSSGRPTRTRAPRYRWPRSWRWPRARRGSPGCCS